MISALTNQFVATMINLNLHKVKQCLLFLLAGFIYKALFFMAIVILLVRDGQKKQTVKDIIDHVF